MRFQKFVFANLFRPEKKQLASERKAFENKKANGQANPAFMADVNQEIDKELRTLREQNEKLTKDISKKNRELNELKKRLKVLEQRAMETSKEEDDFEGRQDEKTRHRRAVIEDDEEDAQVKNVVLQRHSKAVKTTTMLKAALRECDLLKALDMTHIEGLVQTGSLRVPNLILTVFGW